MRPWHHVHAWGQAVRLARRKWPRIPLWAWVRAGCVETGRGEYEPVTLAEAGRVASDVLLTLAEQAHAAEVPTVRRNRDVPGWDACLGPAKDASCITDEILEAAGDAPARETQHFFISQNEVAGIVSSPGIDDPPWSRR